MPKSPTFDQQMSDHQTKWRQDHVLDAEKGWQNGVSRDWILPSPRWEEGLWSGIRKDSVDSLEAYLRGAAVTKHTGVHNLKSSWALCANLYFPFGSTPEAAQFSQAFSERLSMHQSPRWNASTSNTLLEITFNRPFYLVNKAEAGAPVRLHPTLPST